MVSRVFGAAGILGASIPPREAPRPASLFVVGAGECGLSRHADRPRALVGANAKLTSGMGAIMAQSNGKTPLLIPVSTLAIGRSCWGAPKSRFFANCRPKKTQCTLIEIAAAILVSSLVLATHEASKICL